VRPHAGCPPDAPSLADVLLADNELRAARAAKGGGTPAEVRGRMRAARCCTGREG